MLEDKFYQGDTPSWSLAERIVFGILDDLTDRRGLSHEWVKIDPCIKEEILQRWLDIVEKELAR